MSILIENAAMVVDPLAGELLDGQAVAVEGEEIADVGPTNELIRRYPDADRLDGTDLFLLPGLIDAHTHLYAALSLGMPAVEESPRNFPQILERIWWRFDKALRDDDVYVSALVGSIASLRSGITTILDHHASPTAVPDSLSRLAAGVEQVGLRTCLAYEVSDRDGPVSRDQGIAENRRFLLETKARGDSLLKGLFGLHAVFSLSDETLRRCAEEAAELGVGCHMHMVEHLPEVLKFAQSHDQSIADFLADVGILGSQTLVAHTVHIGRADIAVLKDTGTFNVHNPKSNMGNGVGISPVADMLDLSQPVGLGSDGFYDIPQEMVTAKLLQTLGKRDPSAFSDQLALKLVYDHNVRFAERIFNCQLGKIAPGYAADLILVTYSPATPIREWNLSSHILAALNGGAVRTALVNGRVVLRDGEVLGVDEAEVLTQAKSQAAKLWARL
jgi:putative selenium metabolism protein SsnA